MKSSLSRLAMTALVLGSTALVARPAMAQSTVGQFSSKGGFAEIGAETTDPTTGYVNLVEIFVGQSTSHQPGGPSQTGVAASAFFEIYDPVTGNLIDIGFGDLTVNSASLPSGAPKVNSASFSVSGDLVGEITGNTYPVSAGVSLEGSGSPVTQSDHFQEKLPGGVTLNEKSSGTFQENVSVSGDISFDELSLDTLDFAEIGYTKSFEVEISK